MREAFQTQKQHWQKQKLLDLSLSNNSVLIFKRLETNGQVQFPSISQTTLESTPTSMKSDVATYQPPLSLFLSPCSLP